MKRVKCIECISLGSSKRCVIKKVKVSIKKSRMCELFECDLSKFKVKQKLNAVYIPFHERSRKEYKKYIKEEMKKQAVVKAKVTQDCLSNFRSSAPQDA